MSPSSLERRLCSIVGGRWPAAATSENTRRIAPHWSAWEGRLRRDECYLLRRGARGRGRRARAARRGHQILADVRNDIVLFEGVVEIARTLRGRIQAWHRD